MGSELVPNPNHRMGDADREQVVARLTTAVGEGRLTLSEFEDRMAGVLAARTFGEIEPYVADLPAGAVLPAAAGAPLDLSVRGSSIRRDGRWIVPPVIRIDGTGSTIRFDLTEAVIASRVVSIDVQLRGSSLRFTVPPGTTVDTTGVSLHGSSVRARKLESPVPGVAGPHIVITGLVRGSSVRVREPRRWFWQRWRANRTA